MRTPCAKARLGGAWGYRARSRPKLYGNVRCREILAVDKLRVLLRVRDRGR